ncbi:hypothetical protein HY641_00560 [Candidatus Woesearchaeota archaeon]|nr:hypothetical protein [Candidatus Woesearchaeota archaeon]
MRQSSRLQRRMLMTILIVSLISITVLAQSSLKVNFFVAKNHTVTTQTVRAILGDPNDPDTADFPYELLHLDGDKTLFLTHFNANFRRIDTFEDVDEVLITERIPYSGNFGKLRITYQNGSNTFVLWSFDLRQLCDRDNVCDKYENTITCPQDCLIANPDLLCLPRFDNACDPDCVGGIDPDCKPSPAPDYSLIIVVSSIIVVLYFIITLLLYNRRRTKRR